MVTKVGILHTSLVFVNVEPVIKEAFAEYLPDVEVIDFVDSGVLAAVQKDGEITASSEERMRHLAEAAEAAGVDMIFSSCSSLGPAIDHVRESTHVPIIKIDDSMARLAASTANRIGVLATVQSTLSPTVNLINEWANRLGREVSIDAGLAEGAFAALMSGDRGQHDELVLEAARKLAPRSISSCSRRRQSRVWRRQSLKLWGSRC